MAYTVGDAITTTWTLSSDPTDVTLQVKQGAAATTTYTYSLAEITRSGAGVYTKTFLLATAGLCVIEWQATGTIAKVESTTFDVGAQRL